MDERQQSRLSRHGSESSEREGKLLTCCWSNGEAGIIRQLLSTYGIPCRLTSELNRRLFPLSVDGLGEVRVLVPRAYLREARKLLAEHRRQGLRVVRGGKPDPAQDAEEGSSLLRQRE